MSLVKITGRPEAEARVADWRANKQTVVFTNGVFDLLHRGHVDVLAAARAQGDHLVIGVNDDASVQRLKGARRPLVLLEDRMVVLAALECVDLVTAFSEDTPEDLIRVLRPDVLIKGADYEAAEIAGAEFVLGYGGRVETIELTPGRSTTALVGKIRQGD